MTAWYDYRPFYRKHGEPVHYNGRDTLGRVVNRLFPDGATAYISDVPNGCCFFDPPEDPDQQTALRCEYLHLRIAELEKQRTELRANQSYKQQMAAKCSLFVEPLSDRDVEFSEALDRQIAMLQGLQRFYQARLTDEHRQHPKTPDFVSWAEYQNHRVAKRLGLPLDQNDLLKGEPQCTN